MFTSATIKFAVRFGSFCLFRPLFILFLFLPNMIFILNEWVQKRLLLEWYVRIRGYIRKLYKVVLHSIMDRFLFLAFRPLRAAYLMAVYESSQNIKANRKAKGVMGWRLFFRKQYSFPRYKI